MSRSRIYPRLGAEVHGKVKPCIVCQEPTRIRVDVQWSLFRGDDDVARVCNQHRRDINAIVAALERRAKRA